MDPIKAAKLGVDPNEVQISSYGSKHRGQWIVWVPDEERGQRIITSSGDLYKALWWRAQLRMVVHGA